MTHRSKLSQIVIDGTDLHAALAFWAGALALPTAATKIEEPYATIGDIGGLHIVVQRVPEPKTAKSRVHLDIETDDIEAEVRRLEALAARHLEQHEVCWLHYPSVQRKKRVIARMRNVASTPRDVSRGAASTDGLIDRHR